MRVLIVGTLSVSNTDVVSLLVLVSAVVIPHVSVVVEVLAVSVTIRGLPGLV